jgi:L-ascorbate metabolism protein UlaG (beta-lactamase superfamily)
VAINLRWLGTACFEFRLSSGETLIIDPYLDESLTCPTGSSDIERADLICITHGHFDHILDVGRLANRLGSTVICSHEVADNIQKRFHVPESQIQAVTAGDSLKRCNIHVDVVKAVHIDNRAYFAEQLGLERSEEISDLDMVKKVFSTIENQEVRERLLSHMGKYPPGEQLNYIFQFPGNLRLYFFGSVPDPELIPILEECHAQVLILQILRGREEAAAKAAFESGAGIVMPSHHDPFFPGQKVPDVKKVRSLLERNGNVHFVEAEAGKWYEIDAVVREM